MKKILLSLVSIFAVVAVAAGVTYSQFTDTETSTDNTFGAGTLDLQVDGQDSVVPFTVANMLPGQTKGSPTYTITNVGTVPGVVTLKVNNVTTNENGVVEPEASAGDSNGTKLDPDGYTIATSGEGELLDQLYMRFWVDDTAGLRPAPYDWQDTYYANYADESATYHIPVNTDLLDGKNVVLDPGEVMYVGVTAMFIDDTNIPYSWILDGVKNNAAMGDDVKFDLEIGLKQVTP